jgi:exoribonuclease R
LVHRLLTICLKEQDCTRDKIDGIDYSDYAEQISEQSYNSRKASKECQTLFHCFLLKDHGPRVYDCLIFDVESSYLNVYVEELNLNLSVKLREDDRIDQTTFFEEELKVACTFKSPQLLVQGISPYEGDAELKKSKQQKKKEEEIKRMEQDQEDQQRRLNKTEPKQFKLKEENQHSSNCIFSVFDRVKIKIEATDTFPMEISSSLLITIDDMATYEEILAQ